MSSVFRGYVTNYDAIIYLYVLNLQFDILDADEQQHFEPMEVQERKLVIFELFWLFNLRVLSMRALKGEFSLIQLHHFKASHLTICLAPMVGVGEENLCLVLSWLVQSGQVNANCLHQCCNLMHQTMKRTCRNVNVCSPLLQVITSVKGTGQITGNSNVLKARSTIRALQDFFSVTDISKLK